MNYNRPTPLLYKDGVFNSNMGFIKNFCIERWFDKRLTSELENETLVNLNGRFE